MEYVDRLSLRTAEIEHDRIQWDVEYEGVRYTLVTFDPASDR
jgi:hypothetical protein